MAEKMLEPWSTALDEFPLTGPPSEQLRALVRFGVLAPSSHNSQPWLFRILDHRLDLYADRTRALPVSDPEDRELLIGCGSALHHIEVAAHHFGFAGQVLLLPDPGRPDLLASFELGDMRPAEERDHRLFQALRTRHTARFAFEHRSLPQELVAELAGLAAEYGIWLDVVHTESARVALAELVTEADRAQMASPAFRRELAAWLHPNRSRSRDGLPGYAIGLGALASLAAPLVVRTFDLGDGRAAENHDLALHSPLLAVLGTAADDPPGWIETGRALSAVLLRAEAEGVAASFLNQPVELPELRQRLVQLLGHSGFPQLVLRMGYPPVRARGTPRRPVEEILAFHAT